MKKILVPISILLVFLLFVACSKTRHQSDANDVPPDNKGSVSNDLLPNFDITALKSEIPSSPANPKNGGNYALPLILQQVGGGFVSDATFIDEKCVGSKAVVESMMNGKDASFLDKMTLKGYAAIECLLANLKTDLARETWKTGGLYDATWVESGKAPFQYKYLYDATLAYNDATYTQLTFKDVTGVAFKSFIWTKESKDSSKRLVVFDVKKASSSVNKIFTYLEAYQDATGSFHFKSMLSVNAEFTADATGAWLQLSYDASNGRFFVFEGYATKPKGGTVVRTITVVKGNILGKGSNPGHAGSLLTIGGPTGAIYDFGKFNTPADATAYRTEVKNFSVNDNLASFVFNDGFQYNLKPLGSPTKAPDAVVTKEYVAAIGLPNIFSDAFYTK